MHGDLTEGILALAVLAVFIFLATFLMIRMKSRRSRLLVQGSLLLVLGIVAGFIAVLAADGADSAKEASPAQKIALIFILGSLVSWFLSLGCTPCGDEKGGTTDVQ